MPIFFAPVTSARSGFPPKERRTPSRLPLSSPNLRTKSSPGNIPAGSQCDLPVTFLDVFATACALAGTKAETTHPLDSKDMLPTLTGKSKAAASRTLYWDFPGFGSAISDGNLKLVLPKNSKPQLFDLAADIGEKSDLAGQRAEDVKRLTELLRNWQSENVEPLWGPGSEASGPASTPKAQKKGSPAREKIFKQRDTNQDGKITQEEFLAVQADKEQGQERFTKFDKNEDGILDLEEFATMGK